MNMLCKRNRILISSTIACAFVISIGVVAIGLNKPLYSDPAMGKKYMDTLYEEYWEDPLMQIEICNISSYIWDDDMDGLYKELTGRYGANQVRISPRIVETVLDDGYLRDHIQEFKDMGLISPDYGGNTTPAPAAETPAAEPAAEPASEQPTTPEEPARNEFTVKDVDPYDAWATDDCNIRAGADISWEKVGGLAKYDHVTVTGEASTGWYRIKTDADLEAYVSNKYISTDDPRNREAFIYSEKEDKVTQYTFTDTDPEVIDQAIEEIEEEGKLPEPHEHEYTSEVTKEPTCTEPGITTYTCEDGDDTYDEAIPMLEHEAGDWEIVKQETLLHSGQKNRKCTICGKVIEMEVIPANTKALYLIMGICAGMILLFIIILVKIKGRQNRT